MLEPKVGINLSLDFVRVKFILSDGKPKFKNLIHVIEL